MYILLGYFLNLEYFHNLKQKKTRPSSPIPPLLPLQAHLLISGYNCSECALRLYILGIGLGRWAVNRHETGGRQCCRRASVVWAVSWVAMSDSRLYRWWPPEVTRGGQSMLSS